MKDIIEFAEEMLNVQLSPDQKEVLRELEKGEKIVSLISRRPGKKTMSRVWEEYQQHKRTVSKFTAREGRRL